MPIFADLQRDPLLFLYGVAPAGHYNLSHTFRERSPAMASDSDEKRPLQQSQPAGPVEVGDRELCSDTVEHLAERANETEKTFHARDPLPISGAGVSATGTASA